MVCFQPLDVILFPAVILIPPVLISFFCVFPTFPQSCWSFALTKVATPTHNPLLKTVSSCYRSVMMSSAPWKWAVTSWAMTSRGIKLLRLSCDLPVRYFIASLTPFTWGFWPELSLNVDFHHQGEGVMAPCDELKHLWCHSTAQHINLWSKQSSRLTSCFFSIIDSGLSSVESLSLCLTSHFLPSCISKCLHVLFVLSYCFSEMSPVCAVVGGVLGQEVVKVTKRWEAFWTMRSYGAS